MAVPFYATVIRSQSIDKCNYYLIHVEIHSCLFQIRWPRLKKKTPVNISRQRADATKYSDVVSWFDKYQDVLTQLGITEPHCIYNVDEHGTEHSPIVKNIIGEKGRKSFQIQPTEKPSRSTMLTYINAAGFALPPMVIHKGRFRKSWETDKPKG